MTQAIQSLHDIADQFDAIVLDQWGVLHDGSAPYPLAIETLRALKTKGVRLAVLSNSGKRSAPNANRITAMGFDADLFETVMTSGEALWRDIAAQRLAYTSLYPITRAHGDAQGWAKGLDITLTDDLAQADAVLLMGLPDGAGADDFAQILSDAKTRGLPMLCTNPDRASPRADGVVVLSPGALAHDYQDRGGDTRFYGKPHQPVFTAIAETLQTDRLLMVGDSLEHDIAGGHGAGWSTLFIQGGLHASAFRSGDVIQTIHDLARKDTAPLPTYTLTRLS
ncbi:TIGR01459 family HAD-type hydrolase [Octadecabacter sp. G9-8]|uniref:TIGR01459 family HAD-type hydrolase n=1 Tax=Octadecabacter dasysiphoniae TaxID=2909341 RepID=A0ABS9CRH9_9RHOB|nr:TIGR01459 family HAD-type hydrolase [Octadecabacter dasysiphoniae]MCF2869841.1 TIGR01459 family HAD-type hydrolase [Octadecabacter dasysiphoniae]